MSILAAFPWKHLFTRFDVWTVLFWTNVAIIVGLIATLRVSMRRDNVERTPANLDPFLNDEQLEGPRLERVLGWALFFFALFAVTLPLYWLREAARGKGSDAYFQENSIKRGEELYSNKAMPKFNAAVSLQCANCHGTTAGGGAAPYTYTDPKTGLAHVLSWKAPAINTVLYRFSPDEVNDILTRGRPGTPMQGWGVDRKGGGPKNAQSINDLVSYLISVQLPPGTPAQAAEDLKNCTSDTPQDAKTALGQAACAQAAWKAEPGKLYKTAKADLNKAQTTKDDDEKRFVELGCRVTYKQDAENAAAETDAKKQADLILARDECRDLRLKVRDTPDASTPLDTIAKTAAQQHLDALKKSGKATKDELDAAATEVAGTAAQLDSDQKSWAAKNCNDNGTAPNPDDAAACSKLARALRDQKFVATDDAILKVAQENFDWAKEWRDRRSNVGDGQILFETNCARCHTKNWSIFNPSDASLKPEGLLELPGGGGSIGFNLRDGEMQRRFPALRDAATGDLIPNSGPLGHAKFIQEGSADGKAYGSGGRGSGMMPGQCNDAVKDDANAPTLRFYGCMLSSASTPRLSPTKYSNTDSAGGIDDAMIEQILEYERCGLASTTPKLNAADQPSKCE